MPKKKDRHAAGAARDDRVAELTEHLQRLQAEFENFRKRSEADKASFIDLAKKEVVRELLPVLDNLERAGNHLPKELKDDQWANGIIQISKQAEEAFRNLHITRIPTIGQKFDPHLHEAVGSDGSGSELINEELQAGWKMGDKVIRHAIVKLGKET